MVFPFKFFMAAALSMSRNGTEKVPCIVGYAPANASLRGVTSTHAQGLTWFEMDALCQTTYLGWRLSAKVQAWTPEEVALCPIGSLVPLALETNVFGALAWADYVHQPLDIGEYNLLNLNKSSSGTLGALTWPSRNLTLVDASTRFACGVCQPESRDDVLTRSAAAPPRPAYDIALRGSATPDTKLISAQLAVQLNVSVDALRWHGTRTDQVPDGAIHHVLYDPPAGDLLEWPPFVRWNEPDFQRPRVSGFDVVSISPSAACHVDHVDDDVMTRPRLAGAVEAWEDREQDVLVTRECLWDPIVGIAAWTPPANWKLLIKQDCGAAPAHDSSPNGAANFQLMFAVSLFVSTTPGNELVTLETALLASERALALLSAARTALTFVRFNATHLLSKVFAHVSLGSHTELHVTPHVALLVADLDTTNPVSGLTISRAVDEAPFAAAQLNHGNASCARSGSLLEVAVSDAISCCARRLAVAVFAVHAPSTDAVDALDAAMASWIALVHVTFVRGAASTDSSADFVDIAVGAEWSRERPSCAEYTSRLTWSRSACNARTFGDGRRGCRCAARTVSTYLVLAGAHALAPRMCVLLVAFVAASMRTI